MPGHAVASARPQEGAGEGRALRSLRSLDMGRVKEHRVVPRQTPLDRGRADRVHLGAGQRDPIFPSRNGCLGYASNGGKLRLTDAKNVFADVPDCVHSAYIIRKRIRAQAKIIRIGISQSASAGLAIAP